MTADELLKKIKTQGYWRIHFAPNTDEKLSLNQCKEFVEKNSMHLRGWDYPHVSQRADEFGSIQPGDKFWQGLTNWENHIEFWRMYQTGQFIHYDALVEDWTPDLIDRSIWRRDDQAIKPGEILSTLHTTYLLTEIFQFSSRLTVGGLYEAGVKITISLNNTENRRLAILDPRRIPFSEDRKTIAKTIEFDREYSKKELLEQPVDLAHDAILHFFERFDWIPNEGLIKDDQNKLLTRQA